MDVWKGVAETYKMKQSDKRQREMLGEKRRQKRGSIDRAERGKGRVR